jgi:hypothetical protein
MKSSPQKPAVSHAMNTASQNVPAPMAKAQSPSATTCTSPDHQSIHQRQIAECAYFIAESRKFTGGDPIQDWLTAEKNVCCPAR